jgi:ABC-type branched-subunit amino acid transport system permease subunit
VIGETFWARLPEFHRAAFGTLIVVVVLFMPGGVMELLKRRGIIPRNWRV